MHGSLSRWLFIVLVVFVVVSYGANAHAQGEGDYTYSDFWQEEGEDVESWDDPGAMMFAFAETQLTLDEDQPAASEITLEHADGSRCYNATEAVFFARADCQLFLGFDVIEGEVIAVAVHWAVRLFGRLLGRFIRRGVSGRVSAAYIRSEEPVDGEWCYENNFCIRRCTWRTAYYFTIDRGRFMNHRGRYTSKDGRVTCRTSYRFESTGVTCQGPVF